MKKFLQVVSVLLVGLVLVLVPPRAYEGFLPVDSSASLALSAIEPEDVGQSVVECLNQHNHNGVWWDLSSADYLRAHEDLGGSWSPSHYVIAGRLGWRVTWAAIIPHETEIPTAYETFGAENNMDGALFRAELPIRIVGHSSDAASFLVVSSLMRYLLMHEPTATNGLTNSRSKTDGG